MDNQAFNTYLGNIQAIQPQATQPVDPTQSDANAAPTPKPSGNWFTHLLPTGGAIGGGLGGAAIGSAILPGIGTIAGGILGAAFGSGSGKAVENASEGKGIDNGVATSALEGGAGQAIGGVAGKFLGKGAEYLANRAGSITNAAKATADEAAQEAKQLAFSKATQNNFGGVKPEVQSANGLKDNQTLLTSFGKDATSPQEMADASKGGLFINDIHNEALAAGKPIPTSSLLSGKDIMSSSPEEQQALTKSGIITPEGSMPNTVTPQQANSFAQDINGQMRQQQSLVNAATKAGRVDDAKNAQIQLDNLTKMYKNVQNMAASPEVNTAISARTISPIEKQQLVDQYGQQEADHIENAVNTAQTHQDLVKSKLPFAQMNTLSKQALADQQAAGTARGVARTKMDINGDGVADPVPLPSTAEVAQKVASGGGGLPMMAARSVFHSKDNPAILNTLSRFGKLGSKLATPTAIMATTAPGMGASPVSQQPGGTIGGNMNNEQMGSSQQQANPINDLYTTLLNNYKVSGGITPNDANIASVLQSLAPMVQKNQLAGTELAGMPTSFANAGGAQGTGGIMSRISALVPGTAAHTYQAQQQAAAQSLAQALGISPQAAASLLPQLMQNQQSAGNTQGILGNLQGQLAY